MPADAMFKPQCSAPRYLSSLATNFDRKDNTFNERERKMTYPREVLSAFTKRYPRLTSGLYQVSLCVVTAWCAVAIASYGPGTLPDGVADKTCKSGAADENVDIGALAVCSSQESSISNCNCTDRSTQLFFPHFILFPSTTTLISACFLFIAGISTLCYHNRDDIYQMQLITGAVIVTVATIRWKCILPSLQNLLAINIWAAAVVSAVFHPIFRWVVPGHYATIIESSRRQMEAERR